MDERNENKNSSNSSSVIEDDSKESLTADSIGNETEQQLSKSVDNLTMSPTTPLQEDEDEVESEFEDNNDKDEQQQQQQSPIGVENPASSSSSSPNLDPPMVLYDRSRVEKILANAMLSPPSPLTESIKNIAVSLLQMPSLPSYTPAYSFTIGSNSPLPVINVPPPPLPPRRRPQSNPKPNSSLRIRSESHTIKKRPPFTYLRRRRNPHNDNPADRLLMPPPPPPRHRDNDFDESTPKQDLVDSPHSQQDPDTAAQGKNNHSNN